MAFQKEARAKAEAQQGMACWGSKDCQVAEAGAMVV